MRKKTVTFATAPEVILFVNPSGSSAPAMQVPPPPPQPLRGAVPGPPSVQVVVHAWLSYGQEYLNLNPGDVILPMAPPYGVNPEGWAYGQLRGAGV